MNAVDIDSGNKKALPKEGKYLTFLLGDEEYGLEILKVQEIIQMQSVTRVPNTPVFIRGVINLRGKVIPVVELRSKLGLTSCADTKKTCIIVVEVNSNNKSLVMSIIIDEVKEVQDIEAKDMEPPPDFGISMNPDFLLGMGKVGGKVKLLLDIDRILSGEDVNELQQLTQKA